MAHYNKNTINPLHRDRMQKQDDTLDLISQGLGRLGENASKTKMELDEQNRDLYSLDNDVENNLNDVNLTNIKMKQELNRKDCCGRWCIIGMVAIIAICIILLIWA